jgi:hypothetical protein
MYVKVMLTLLVVLEAAAAAMMWHMARPDPAVARYTDDEVAAGLHRRVHDVRFEAVALEEAIRMLARETGATVNVDWVALAGAGIDRLGPVSLSLRDVPLATALSELTDDYAAVRPDGATVMVTAYDQYDLDAPRAVLRVYDVRESVATSDPAFRDALGETLADIFTTCVVFHVWDAPAVGFIRYSDGVLLVFETPERQRDVEGLLAQLRRASEDPAWVVEGR